MTDGPPPGHSPTGTDPSPRPGLRRPSPAVVAMGAALAVLAIVVVAAVVWLLDAGDDADPLPTGTRPAELVGRWQLAEISWTGEVVEPRPWVDLGADGTFRAAIGCADLVGDEWEVFDEDGSRLLLLDLVTTYRPCSPGEGTILDAALAVELARRPRIEVGGAVPLEIFRQDGAGSYRFRPAPTDATLVGQWRVVSHGALGAEPSVAPGGWTVVLDPDGTMTVTSSCGTAGTSWRLDDHRFTATDATIEPCSGDDDALAGHLSTALTGPSTPVTGGRAALQFQVSDVWIGLEPATP